MKHINQCSPLFLCSFHPQNAHKWAACQKGERERKLCKGPNNSAKGHRIPSILNYQTAIPFFFCHPCNTLISVKPFLKVDIENTTWIIAMRITYGGSCGNLCTSLAIARQVNIDSRWLNWHLVFNQIQTPLLLNCNRAGRALALVKFYAKWMFDHQCFMFYAKCLTRANICFGRTFKVSHCTAV